MSRILFISPTFFGYYREIKRELEVEENIVDYVADIPKTSNMYKAITRVNRNFGKPFVRNYFRSTIRPLISNNKYDFVFIIVGMTFSLFEDMIEEMKNKQPNAKFIIYQWDGEKNIKFVNSIHKYFDKIYSFDRIDCLNNKNKYTFLPLFYIDKYKDIKQHDTYEYDVSYIGTAHPKKIKTIMEMSKQLLHMYNKQYIYNYMPSLLKYYYHKVTSKSYRKIKLNDLQFQKLSQDETMKIFENSMCILDSPQEGQNGLTIRTIECLGAKRKMITSNKDIVNYDFYLPENIYVYEGKFDFNSIFFKSKYKELPSHIYEYYSLKNWLKIVISQ